MDVPVTDRFHAKQGRSTGRLHSARTAMPALAVYLKRHYRLPWWRGLLAPLWPGGGWSPALQEWQHLERARWRGGRAGAASRSRPASSSARGAGCRASSPSRSCTTCCRCTRRSRSAMRSSTRPTFARWKRGLIAEMARLAALLHGRRWFHKDLYLCHFYIARADHRAAARMAGATVAMIDLHRLASIPGRGGLADEGPGPAALLVGGRRA